MRISIAMTTYRGASYLPAQLESLRVQTRPADEVIICDDGSDDETAQIVTDYIRDYQLTGWKFYQNEQNLGYRLNFRQAIEKTTGDLIFLSDQDDVWKPEKLGRMEGMFLTHPDMLSLNTGFDPIDASGTPIAVPDRRGWSNHNLIPTRLKAGELRKFPAEQVYTHNLSPGCTMAFTVQLKQEFLRTTKSVLPHDWDLNAIAAAEGGAYFWNVPLISYRLHGNNTIGLPGVGKKRSRKQKDRTLRTKIATEYAQFLDALHDELADKLTQKQKQKLDRTCAFANLRVKVLTDRRIRDYLRLWKYPRIYRRQIRFRGRVLDFLRCVLAHSDL